MVVVVVVVEVAKKESKRKKTRRGKEEGEMEGLVEQERDCGVNQRRTCYCPLNDRGGTPPNHNLLNTPSLPSLLTHARSRHGQ